jgi:hypothetical protein
MGTEVGAPSTTADDDVDEAKLKGDREHDTESDDLKVKAASNGSG